MESIDDADGSIEQVLVGDLEFTLTLDAVRVLDEKYRHNVENAPDAATNPDHPAYSFASGLLKSSQAAVDRRLTVTAEQEIELMKQIFDRCRELEARGTRHQDIIRSIMYGFPQIDSSYSGLLHEEVWGYRLYQGILGTKRIYP